MRLLLLLALLTACAGQGADPVLEALNGIRADGRGCGGVHHPPAPPLAWEARLRAAAQAHTEAMAAHGFVGHVAPDGSPVRERTGYPWSALGENVAQSPIRAEARKPRPLRQPHGPPLRPRRALGAGRVLDPRPRAPQALTP